MKTFENVIEMRKGSKIERWIAIEEFMNLIEDKTEDQIYMTDHVFSHIEKRQRKIFKDATIKHLIKSKLPILVGIQKNGLYAAFYGYGKDLVRLILDMQPGEIRLVTFVITRYDKIPRLK